VTPGQQRIVWGGVFLASLAVSVLFHFLAPRPLQAAVLFFPSASNQGVQSEIHFLPPDGTAAGRVRKLVEAALAGPLSLKFRRIAPAGSTVRAVFSRGDTVYVDLSADFQAAASDCPLPPLRRVALLNKAFKYNEHEAARLVFLIQGKELASDQPSVGRKS
jgi:hypothetical protein